MRLELDRNSLEDLQYWLREDRKKALKIFQLLDEILKTPFRGTGKPEPLKYVLAGCWSRRIDQTHRLVYKVEKDTVVILSCRYHY